MADTKISGLTALTGATTASGDLLTIVDVSDTTMAATGTNKKITLTELQSAPVSGGTANGVLYLNGSKVATSGSALTFDGTGALVVSTSATNGAISVVGPSSGSNSGAQFNIVNGATTTSIIGNYSRVIGGAYNESLAFYNNGNDFVWYSGSERMRLTSTGLGIGTSSPENLLQASSRFGVSSSGVVRWGQTITVSGRANSGYLTWDTGLIAIGYEGAGAIAFQTNSAERMRLDSSGNLGLGVTPSAWGSNYKAFNVGNTGSLAGDNNFGLVELGNNYYNNNTNNIYKYNGNASTYKQYLGEHRWYNAASGTAGNAITFTQALTLNTNGALVLKGGDTSASGVGIAFPATQSASSNANTLDDYEEGTWTATLVSSGGGSVTVTSSAKYIKVGNLVFVSVESYSISTTGLSAGDLTITGLPFTCNTNSPAIAYFDIAGAVTASVGSVMVYAPNSTTMSIFKTESTTAGVALLQKADLNSNVSIRFNGTYTV